MIGHTAVCEHLKTILKLLTVLRSAVAFNLGLACSFRMRSCKNHGIGFLVFIQRYRGTEVHRAAVICVVDRNVSTRDTRWCQIPNVSYAPPPARGGRLVYNVGYDCAKRPGDSSVSEGGLIFILHVICNVRVDQLYP